MANLKTLAVLAIQQRSDLTGLLLTGNSLSIQYGLTDVLIHEDGEDFTVTAGAGTIPVKQKNIYKELDLKAEPVTKKEPAAKKEPAGKKETEQTPPAE